MPPYKGPLYKGSSMRVWLWFGQFQEKVPGIKRCPPLYSISAIDRFDCIIHFINNEQFGDLSKEIIGENSTFCNSTKSIFHTLCFFRNVPNRHNSRCEVMKPKCETKKSFKISGRSRYQILEISREHCKFFLTIFIPRDRLSDAFRTQSNKEVLS